MENSDRFVTILCTYSHLRRIVSYSPLHRIVSFAFRTVYLCRFFLQLVNWRRESKISFDDASQAAAYVRLPVRFFFERAVA